MAYPNLNSRVLGQESLEMATKLLRRLVGLRCRNTWYKVESGLNSSHTFVFQFQLNEPMNENLDENLSKSKESTVDYLNYNNEEDYLVLQVKVRDFTRVQFAEHTSFLEFSMDTNLSSLTMVFGCSNQDKRRNEDESIVIKSVSAIQLLRWWHPSYPHRD